MAVNIVAINLGGTTTKVAYSVNNVIKFKETIEHTMDELGKLGGILGQKDIRLNSILHFLKLKDVDISEVTAIVTRAAGLPPVHAGAYEVTEEMTAVQLDQTKGTIQHASRIGTRVAFDLARQAGPSTKVYIYDSETMDELADIARFTGTKHIPKQSLGHLLNMRAVARSGAEKIDKRVEDCNFVVAHMGGGTSVCVIERNRIIDVLADDEGPFSVERAGSIALKHIIKMCYEMPREEVMRILRNEGGLYSYLGTNDGREIEKQIADGSACAALVYEALAYQVSKACGDMAVALKGNLDGIILTGGLANSKMICNWIEKWAGFLGSIICIPGEFEMESLASGAYRVVVGEEQADILNFT